MGLDGVLALIVVYFVILASQGTIDSSGLALMAVAGAIAFAAHD